MSESKTNPEITQKTHIPGTPLNVDDYHRLAKQKLPKMVYDYYASGAEDQVTLRSTRPAFNRLKLLPRMLVDVSKQDTSLELFGHKLCSPVLIAPTAMQRLAHPDGEIATARAAASAKTVMSLSSLSTSTSEDVANATSGPKFFQLYVLKRRELTERIVAKLEQLNYSAILLTVDTPFLGRRENDIRNQFHLPSGLKLEVLRAAEGSELPQGLNNYFANQIDSSVSWKDIAWLRSITKLPILVKGILSPQDAILAIDHGADGIVVSNHGARQLDTVPATIEVLPYIVKAVKGKVPILFDGGIRRGTDVFKALALGAKAVFIGRPVLWGLAVNGEQGVADILHILHEEFKLAMALAGCAKLSDITDEFIFDHQKLSKL